MRLHALNIEGFRSFFKKTTVLLDELGPGLIHVAGENGAGKSTIFDAICWCVFGKTARGLKGPAIVSWEKPACTCVELSTDVGNIMRTQNPNSLQLDGREVTQEQLNAHIRCNFETFLHTVYFAQFNDSFIDLRPEQRMSMYAEALSLSLWDTGAQLAARVAGEYKDEADQEALIVQEFKGELRALRSEDFSAEAARWENKHTQEYESMTAEMREKISSLKGIDRMLLEATRAAQTEKNVAEGRVASHAELAKWIDRETQATKKLNQLSRRGFKCPTCGQKWPDQEHRKKEVEAVREEIRHAQLQQTAAQRTLKQLPDGTPAQDALRDLKHKRDSYIDRIDALDRQIATHKKEVNPWRDRISTQARKVRDAEVGLQNHEARVVDYRKQQAAFQFWATAYKDIRLEVIEESLIQLNVETNEALQALGLDDWELRFTIEKETKGGGVKRGFQVEVRAPGAPEFVPWEAWSGGETQRLRIAAQMGTANMLSSRTGFSCNLEMWDEPSAWLNNEGVEDLVAHLADRADTLNKTLLLADHRVLEFPFPLTLTVVKNDQGSRVDVGT